MGSNLKDIVESNGVYIIAEIGQNHQGDLEHAKKLIQKAAEAGVNAVKSQKRHKWKLNNYDRKRCKDCSTKRKEPYECCLCGNGICKDHSKLHCNFCKSVIIGL